jgi:hypothetical protein
MIPLLSENRQRLSDLSIAGLQDLMEFNLSHDSLYTKAPAAY